MGIKKRTISINGIEIPEPERKELTRDTIYFIPNPLIIYETMGFTQYYWHYDNFDLYFLKKGLIHLTKEAAIQHAKALLSFTEIKDDATNN
jgi:hypothetical protein